MKNYKKGDIIVFKYFPPSPHTKPCEKVGKIIMAFDFLDFPPNYMVIYEKWYLVDVNNKGFQVSMKDNIRIDAKDIIRIATSEDIFLYIMEGDFKP